MYYLFYQFVYKKYERTKWGEPLKEGISAIVCAKDESYTVFASLKSLLGVVDQIICVDTGSIDDTLFKMQEFKKQYQDQVDITILALSNPLLVDSRQTALDLVKYSWHLRWDADMIAHTTGDNSLLKLREKIIRSKRPRAIKIPFVNIYGDLQHTFSFAKTRMEGEKYLVKTSEKTYFFERNRFEIERIPIYYQIIQDKKVRFFHCGGLKSALRQMFRHVYLDWRMTINQETNIQQKAKLQQNFEEYKRRWVVHNFETSDEKLLTFRIQRLEAVSCQPYVTDIYGDYPEIIKECLMSNQRFKIQYKNDQPYIRIDLLDEKMKDYKPNVDDLLWLPSVKSFYTNSVRLNFDCRL